MEYYISNDKYLVYQISLLQVNFTEVPKFVSAIDAVHAVFRSTNATFVLALIVRFAYVPMNVPECGQLLIKH